MKPLLQKGRLIIAGLHKAKCRWCQKPGITKLCSCPTSLKLVQINFRPYQYFNTPQGPQIALMSGPLNALP
jgi:hypothetical protein